MTAPRAVIAAPLYGQACRLEVALQSLLAQTYRDFALVLVDDCSPDETVAVARALTAGDPRVEVHVNPRRLGMLANTNRAWALSRERFPDAPYWAIASDHDVWSPTWLERLVAVLDARPEVVLAYPRTRRIDARGAEVAGPWRFDTSGITDPRARVRHALRRMVSGDMIYGLFRAAALGGAEFYEPVLAPDRLRLSRLALQGEFAQVPEVLWSRRYEAPGSLARQRNAFWPATRPPASTYVPWFLTHTAAFGRDHGISAALHDYLPAGAAFQLRSRAVRARNALLVPPARAAVRSPPGRRIVLRHVVPALRETREVLERLAREPDS